MNIYRKIVLIIITISLMSMTSDKTPYNIFNLDGKQKTYEKMLKALEEADMVFFGELHNNAISHWFELELAKDLYAKMGENLIIGAEMFEADQQLMIDEYLKDLMTKKIFEEQARLWKNHSTDYAPILDFAKEKKIKFVATNIPRRYAALVNKSGFSILNSLNSDALRYIAPLPIKYDENVGCYKEMKEMMKDMPGARHGNSFIAEAQAIKDATMAHFILTNWKKGQTFYHFNGSYHSNNHEGIVWYIKQQQPDIKIITINTIEQENIDTISKEDMNSADFIIVTDEDFTKTY
jgi:uncharacterized iron-regulated protein